MGDLVGDAEKGISIISKITNYFYLKRKTLEDMAKFVSDNSDLKEEFNNLKLDISDLKSKVSNIKMEISNMKMEISDIKAFQNKIAKKQEELVEKQNEMAKKIENLEKTQKIDDEDITLLKSGIKYCLLNTLYSFWREYVHHQGYASMEQKKYISNIYKVYHNGLEGNNVGDYYYDQIMDLPDSLLPKKGDEE